MSVQQKLIEFNKMSKAEQKKMLNEMLSSNNNDNKLLEQTLKKQ